jgi:hypothetical protein
MTLEMELKNPTDYFPYIGHDLNQEALLKHPLWKNVVGSLFSEKHITETDEKIVITGDAEVPLFREVIVYGVSEQRKITNDSFAVSAIVPRHRTLYDYGIGMPVHSRLINREVMILAGSNLFVAAYDTWLRHYGAFMFLREDTVLKRKGYPKVFLSIERYLQEVFPAYLNYQMFEGVGENKLKRDMIVYPEQEKNPITKKRNGGRTKTGKLRELSHIIFENFRKLTRESSTKLYISPVCVSFSKYPDATFIVHPVKHGGIVNDLRYVHEQNFTGSWYTKHALKHPEAKLEAIVRYGEPELFCGDDFKTFHDIVKYTKQLKRKIGLLESIFPTTLLFRALEEDKELPFTELENRARKLYDHYLELGINMEKVSVSPGNMMPIEEMADRAILTLNSNAPYMIYGLKTDVFIEKRAGRFVSLDENLQTWYANNLRHLDP